HKLETGDRVHISNFTTQNTVHDANVISSVNRTAGHVINVTSNTTFTIDIDMSSIYIQGAGTVNVVQNNTTITGNGTAFTTLFNVGDNISILGAKYLISAIASNTSLTVSSPYLGTTQNTLTYYRDNRSSTGASIYFASK